MSNVKDEVYMPELTIEKTQLSPVVKPSDRISNPDKTLASNCVMEGHVATEMPEMSTLKLASTKLPVTTRTNTTEAATLGL